MFFFHSCQVPTRRDQLSTKNANSEGRRGRGRGGRGRGRGGRAQVKTIEEKESDQYGYDDSEMWAEFWKWQYGWEESHAADHTVGGDKVEKVSKKRKAETKEKTEDTTKPKSVKTDPEHCKKRKETNEMAPAKASKALKKAVVKFAKRFDYHNLDLDNMKVRVKEELPVLKNISFNCYWTRAACGVRQKQDGPGSEFKEVPSAYFRFPTCHASHNLQLAVAVGASIQLVSHLLPQPEEKNLTSLLNLLFKKSKTIPLTSCLSQANFIAEGEGNITQDQIENLSTELKVCGPRVISSLVDIEWEPKVFQAWGICGNHWFSQGFWQECFLVDLKFRATFLFSTSGTWPQASNRNIGHWTNQDITNLISNI